MDTAVPTLPPEVFESLVNVLAEALIRDYRERWSRRGAEAIPAPPQPAATSQSPWLKVADAAKRAQCGRPTIYSGMFSVSEGHRRSLKDTSHARRS